MVERGILMEFQPWSPIFEKCPHLREKAGVLMLLKTHSRPKSLFCRPAEVSSHLQLHCSMTLRNYLLQYKEFLVTTSIQIKNTVIKNSTL